MPPAVVDNAPHTYRRRILLVAAGLSPQVITETLYVLAVRSSPAFVPTEIHLMTTAEGAKRATEYLLGGDRWLQQLCADYQLPAIAFSADTIHVLTAKSGELLADIRSIDDNQQAADQTVARVRILTNDADAALHVSIAGGRKTMGFFAGYALSLYGRRQDRLSHVLVSPPFESNPQFFYPTPYSRPIPAGAAAAGYCDAQDAKVMLATIPFIRIREGLPQRLLDDNIRFSDLVAAAQSAIQLPPSLKIDLAAKSIAVAGKTIRLQPQQLAFLAWFARRRREEAWLTCPNEGAAEPSHAQDFLREYRAIGGNWGSDERTEKRLAQGMTNEFFSQAKSKLQRRLSKELGVYEAQPYLIESNRYQRPHRYRLRLEPTAIHFAPVEELAG